MDLGPITFKIFKQFVKDLKFKGEVEYNFLCKPQCKMDHLFIVRKACTDKLKSFPFYPNIGLTNYPLKKDNWRWQQFKFQQYKHLFYIS
jgi:hypothetical protein